MGALVAWFTGLSGAGKSTIAEKAASMLEAKGQSVLVLDGDVVRSTVTRHLGFSREDIYENNRSFINLCRTHAADHDVILVPKISPFLEQRASARRELEPGFVEVYVRASLEEVFRRDPKGLYRKSSEGSLQNMVGVAAEVPYEPPKAADLTLDTETDSVEACTQLLVDYLCSRVGAT